MKGMEIEKKFLIKTVPEHLEQYTCHLIEQAYLCTEPVVRIRRQDDDYILTWKGKGMMEREEYNLPLTKEGYYHLLTKADGNIITKKRYVIPLPNGRNADKASADNFMPPSWFGADVTFEKAYHNSFLSTVSKWSLS